MFTEITPTQLVARLQDDPNLKIVDVREPNEFASAHIANSVNIPLGSLGDHLPGIGPEETVIMVCRVGRRSTTACERLVENHKGLMNLAGGVEWWNSLGLPLVSDPA